MPDNDVQVKVQLGAHEYTVVPQPHAIILKKFPQLVQGAEDLDGVEMEGYESIVDLLGEKVYDAIKIFIPNLMPRHEWEGYGTKQAWEHDQEIAKKSAEGKGDDGDILEWDESVAVDLAPTLPQIFDAFDKGFIVNGGKRLKDLLGNVLGPEVSRAVRSFVVARLRVGLSQLSLSSPSTSDGSQISTTSGQRDQTPEDLVEQENEDSQLPVS